MPPKKKEAEGSGELTRIAIVSSDRCRPKKCKQECKKSCPVVKCGACRTARRTALRRLAQLPRWS